MSVLRRQIPSGANMNITHGSSVVIDPSKPFSVSLVKVETNRKKDQLTFSAIIKHDSGTLPEGTIIKLPFTNVKNSKKNTKDPIWVSWKPEQGLFSFTMEIEPSPNSDTVWEYAFETEITCGGETTALIFTSKLSRVEYGPKITPISAKIHDNWLKVVVKVTRDDGRSTRRAGPVIMQDKAYHIWNPTTGELTTNFKMDNLTGKLVDVDLTFPVAIDETPITTDVVVKSPVPRTKTLRSRVVGGFVQDGKLTFVTNFRWDDTGKAPQTLSIPSTLEEATNVPSGSVKTSKVNYDADTGNLRVTIKADSVYPKVTSYELGMLVSADEFDPQYVKLEVNATAQPPKYAIAYGKPVLNKGRYNLPFDVTDVSTGEKVPASLLNDYQQNALMSKNISGPKSPTVVIKDGKSLLSWGVDLGKTGQIEFKVMGIYSFKGNEFLYDSSINFDIPVITEITSEIKTADIIETVRLSKSYPFGSIKLVPDEGAPYEKVLEHTSPDVIKLTFRGAARTLQPTKRDLFAGLVFGTDYNWAIVFHDKVTLYMTKGDGELIHTPVRAKLVGPKTVEVATKFSWADETTPINVIMEDTVTAANGSVQVKKWEYSNKEGILTYYVDVVPTGMLDQFDFTAHVSAPDYGLNIGLINTKFTIGSNFYPYLVSGVKSTLRDDGKLELKFGVRSQDGTPTVITGVTSVEESYPRVGNRPVHDFSFKNGIVTLITEVEKLTWDIINYSMDVRLEDGNESDNSDKVATVEFTQEPKFDASIGYGGLSHIVENGKRFTEIWVSIDRHDEGKTTDLSCLGGYIPNATFISARATENKTRMAVKLRLNDPMKSQVIKGTLDFLVDGYGLSITFEEKYDVPGVPELKEMKLGDDLAYPLEVTWIIGDWSSIPAEYISLNQRLWENRENGLPGEPVGEWCRVNKELTVKFPVVVDRTKDMHYSGKNVFMLPTPDASIYPISFEGVIESNGIKAPWFSAVNKGKPIWNDQERTFEFSYDLSNTKGNAVGKVKVESIKYLYGGEFAQKDPIVPIRVGDTLRITQKANNDISAMMFDITLSIEGAPNKVTLRTAYATTDHVGFSRMLYAEILPKTDIMRIYWTNMGVQIGELSWVGSKNVRQCPTTMSLDEESNLLYGDFVVFLNEKQDTRHFLTGANIKGICFDVDVTIYGTEKPFNRMVLGDPKVTVADQVITYVYPAKYEGTQIGPKDVTGKVVSQTGTFAGIDIKGNATGSTVTISITKYPSPHPGDFDVVVELRDGNANKPTTVKLRV